MTTTPRADGGLTSGRAHDDINRAVTELMRRHHVPGLSLAVVDPARTLFAGGFGLADVAQGRPAAAQTLYAWFSMSKIVTATAALRLADEGALDLAAPLADYLAYVRAPRHAQPTVGQLLDHSAGFANPLPLRWVHAAGEPGPDPEAMLRRLMRRRGAFRYEPGSQSRYSNVGYLALGQVIAAAAGVPFTEYVERAVLQPTGMTATGYGYSPGAGAGAGAATGYVRARRPLQALLRLVLPAEVIGQRTGRLLSLRPFSVDGAAYGGLVGDVLDAARFVRLHLNGGQLDGRRVLAADTTARMRTVTRAGAGTGRALGWLRRPDSGAGYSVEHLGAGAGFFTVMRLYPERSLGVVLMANTTTRFDVEPLMTALTGLAVRPG